MDTTNDTNEIKILQQKAEHFFARQIKIHITLKNGRWKRGLITDNKSADFFMLNETFEGEQPVFYLEIKDLEPYKERGI